MTEFNANQYREMYQRMGINIDKLGCIMLDLEPLNIPDANYPPDTFVVSKNPDRFWIKGFVGGGTAHVTVLYGLIYPICNQLDVSRVLGDEWSPKSVEIDHIGYFESPYEDEPYYCIVAHVKITDELLEGHRRLELLPHINTFPEYKAHITLAYIRKSASLKEVVMNNFAVALEGKQIGVEKINYGKDQHAYGYNPFNPLFGKTQEVS